VIVVCCQVEVSATS